MAPYVEANSLSDITQLASNPPKYPRNPTEKKRQPLTLYIARVPGNRDIILTTLKPQLKNVTAEDVASSLYYFHLDSEEDAQLLAEETGMIVEEDEPSEVIQKPLPRKPLPDSARSSIDLNRQLPVVPDYLTTFDQPREVNRKALPAKAQPPAQVHLQVNDPVARKPLGPRPLLSELSIDKKPLPGLQNRPLSSGAQSYGATFNKTIGAVESKSPPGSTKSFSITIIRRDPSSGAQWNVGKVLGEGQDSANKPSHSRKVYFDMSVHLTTPGYTQFRDPQTNFKTGNNATVGNSSSVSDTSYPMSGPGFDRQIRMEGSNFWDRPKQHIRSHSDVSGRISPEHQRNQSSGSPDDSREKAATDYAGAQESGTKGYVFGSPWGGRCKFSTSSSGRTLRCKHTLPGPVSATPTVESGTSLHASAPVSELRFNLPSLSRFHGSPNSVKSPTHESSRFQIPKFGHIRNKLSPEKIMRPAIPPLPPRPHPTSYASMYPSDDEDLRPPLPPRLQSSYATESSDEDVEDSPPVPDRLHPHPYTPMAASDEEGRLDLSIGQEKAGGGNRGKRAKLGKLIILDEGFKMLDLVVAANIGIWWSVWESSS